MYRTLSYISIISVLLPFLCGLIKIKTLSNTLKVLFFYIAICAVTELLSYILPHYSMNEYYALQNTFTLIEFSSLVTIYYLELGTKAARMVIVLLFGVYWVFAIIELFFKGTYFEPNNIITSLESGILSGLSIYFFFRIQYTTSVQSIYEYSFFWLNCAVLIYLTTSLLFFIFDAYIVNCTKPVFHILWSLHLFTNILFNILLAVALWKTKLNWE